MRMTIPAESGPAVAQTPVSTADWRRRIGELKQQLADAEQALAEKAAARKKSAGRLLLGIGGTLDAVEALEREENSLEHEVDSLSAAIELAEHELRRIENAERQARLEARRQRRVAVAAEIVEHAAAVDQAFAAAGDHLRAIDQLIVQFRVEGGIFNRSLRGCGTRAVKANPALRDYVLAEYVGGHEHLVPLAQQLAGLAVVPGTDEGPAA